MFLPITHIRPPITETASDARTLTYLSGLFHLSIHDELHLLDCTAFEAVVARAGVCADVESHAVHEEVRKAGRCERQ